MNCNICKRDAHKDTIKFLRNRAVIYRIGEQNDGAFALECAANELERGIVADDELVAPI